MAAYTGFWGLLHDWQDLAGALASALVAAVAVVIAIKTLGAQDKQVRLGWAQLAELQRQEAERREARVNAVRGALNATLSSLTAWVEGVAHALTDLPVLGPLPMTARAGFTVSRIEAADHQVLVDAIEATGDLDVRLRLNRLLSNIQVLTARVSAIPKARGGLTLTASNIDSYLLDAVVIHAQISSCFDYARRIRGTVASRLTSDDLDTAMMCLNLVGPRFHPLIERISLVESEARNLEDLYGE